MKSITPSSKMFLIDSLFFTVLKLDEKINFYEQFRNDFEQMKEITDARECFDLATRLFLQIADTYYGTNAESSLSECILKFLESHYGNAGLTIEEVAEQFSMTSQALYNYFKSTWGKTFAVMLEEIRLKHSIELMKTDLTIEQIASSVGYNSSHTFRRAFKRHFDNTPVEYREKFLS